MKNKPKKLYSKADMTSFGSFITKLTKDELQQLLVMWDVKQLTNVLKKLQT